MIGIGYFEGDRAKVKNKMKQKQNKQTKTHYFLLKATYTPVLYGSWPSKLRTFYVQNSLELR